MIEINIAAQTLKFDNKIYSISSAKNGTSEVEGSFCTPTGKFKIASMIGAGLEIGSVLMGRAATGEIYSAELGAQHPDRDWILTRILWLQGIEAHNQNTQQRYIYIHGTPDETLLGVPNSKGCIRMRNDEIIEIFDKITPDEIILIQ